MFSCFGFVCRIIFGELVIHSQVISDLKQLFVVLILLDLCTAVLYPVRIFKHLTPVCFMNISVKRPSIKDTKTMERTTSELCILDFEE